MKSRVLLLVLALAALTGCATHYQQVENDRAYLFLKNRHARSVMFASSIDRFQWHRADKIDTRTWRVALMRNVPQSYVYLIDDQLFVPDCRFREKDDFGSENCLYVPGM